MNEIRYYILYAVLFVLSNIATIVLTQWRTSRKLSKGIQTLLQRELKQIHHHCIRKGYATPEEKNEFERIYSVYHSLGKNGVMDVYRIQVLDLPDYKK